MRKDHQIKKKTNEYYFRWAKKMFKKASSLISNFLRKLKELKNDN